MQLLIASLIYAAPMTSERAKAICSFLLQCFSVMVVPNTIKIDDKPAYTSKKI